MAVRSWAARKTAPRPAADSACRDCRLRPGRPRPAPTTAPGGTPRSWRPLSPQGRRTPPRRCRRAGCVPSPRDFARPRLVVDKGAVADALHQAPYRHVTNTCAHCSSSPRNSLARALTSVSRIARPVNCADASPLRFLGEVPPATLSASHRRPAWRRRTACGPATQCFTRWLARKAARPCSPACFRARSAAWSRPKSPAPARGRQSREKQRIDAGGLIGLRPHDRIPRSSKLPAAAPRTGAAHDHQCRIAASIERGLHLADTFLERDELGLRTPKACGSSVSSMVRPAAPAVSSSCTVRRTLSALP